MSNAKKSISIISIIAILLGGYLLIFHWAQVKTVLVNWKNAIINSPGNISGDTSTDPPKPDKPTSTKVVLSCSLIDMIEGDYTAFIDNERCTWNEFVERQNDYEHYAGYGFGDDSHSYVIYWRLSTDDWSSYDFTGATLVISIDGVSYSVVMKDKWSVSDCGDISSVLEAALISSATSTSGIKFDFSKTQFKRFAFQTLSVDKLTLANGVVLYENV